MPLTHARDPMPLTPRPLRWLLITAFGAALILTLFFGFRLAMGAFYWSNPAHQDQPIEGWMPLGYVGRSWDIPREALLQITGIPGDSLPRRSLEAIARDTGVPLRVLIARIEAGIAGWREQQDD